MKIKAFTVSAFVAGIISIFAVIAYAATPTVIATLFGQVGTSGKVYKLIDKDNGVTCYTYSTSISCVMGIQPFSVKSSQPMY